MTNSQKALVWIFCYAILAALVYAMAKYGELPGVVCLMVLIGLTGIIAWLVQKQFEVDKTNNERRD